MEYHILKTIFTKRTEVSRETLIEQQELTIPVKEPNQFSKEMEASATATWVEIPIPVLTNIDPAKGTINYGYVSAKASEDFLSEVPPIKKGDRFPFSLKMRTPAGTSEYRFLNGFAFLPNDLTELHVMLEGTVGKAIVTAYMG